MKLSKTTIELEFFHQFIASSISLQGLRIYRKRKDRFFGQKPKPYNEGSMKRPFLCSRLKLKLPMKVQSNTRLDEKNYKKKKSTIIYRMLSVINIVII